MAVSGFATRITARQWAWGLWRRWVVANALGEALGLGTTALVTLALFALYGEGTGTLAVVMVAIAAVVAGTVVEGVTVGTAQWWVLRRQLPRLAWITWAGATAVGAGVAWTFGMLPSTLLSLGQGANQAPAAEPSAAVIYGLAFLMGLVLGPILGCAQWFVLRRYVSHASLWMPANALAWAFGMALVFALVSTVVDRGLGPGASVLAVLGLATTGAVVGGIHGLVLVWLLDQQHRAAALRGD